MTGKGKYWAAKYCRVVLRALVIAGLIGLPLNFNRYGLFILSQWAVMTIAAMGLNLTLGYAGQVSLAQGAFVGIGAYAAAIMTSQGLPLIAALGVAVVLCFAVGWLLFGISLGRQPWLLLLPTVAIVFAGTAFGLIVAALATSREAVLPIGSIAIVTMAAVGGCWWPIDLEPRWMRQAALAFPTTWAMEAFNDLMIRRRGIEAALRPTAVMLAFGLLYLVVGMLLFRRRVTR